MAAGRKGLAAKKKKRQSILGSKLLTGLLRRRGEKGELRQREKIGKGKEENGRDPQKLKRLSKMEH